MTAPELDLFVRRLHRLLRTRPEIFEVGKLKKIRGYCKDDGSKIGLDYRDELIPTLLHEVLHYVHPDWDEQKVLKHEKIIINKLSKTRVKNIIKRFASVL